MPAAIVSLGGSRVSAAICGTPRALRRAPGLSAFVVLTLAFGIGANVTVFSLVHAVLLDSLPFRDADRIVVVREANSVPDYEYLSQKSAVFSNLGAWLDENMTLVTSGSTDRIMAARASASFFSVLGVEPVLGRGFLPEEDRPGGAHVAILSYHAWQSRFGGDPRILGRPIRVNAESLTVVGVLPPSFWYRGEPVEVWVPRVGDNRYFPAESIRLGAGILTDIVARLRPGVSVARADAAVQELSPKDGPSRRVSVVPIRQHAASGVRPSLLLLWGAAGCILLVTCANTASLLLARATVRRQEIAVRLALGASRGKLVRQLLAESLLLAGAGGAVGLPLARAGLAAVTALTGHSLTGWHAVEMGGPAIAFAMGASLLSALLFGLAPAWQALRCNARDGLQDSSRGGSSTTQPRLRSALVVAQTAVAAALAMSAGLLLQSYARMGALPTGVRADGLVTAWVRIPDSRYGAPEQRVKFYDELLRRLRVLPGVPGVGATSYLQLEADFESALAWPEGTPADAPRARGIRNRVVSPGYFQVLGIPLLAGREFAETDSASSPQVMLVNEAFVRRYFPDGHGVGRHVTYSTQKVTCEIVGVVADVRTTMTDADPRPEMFFPYMQRSRHQMSLILRSHLTPGALERAIRGELAKIDPEQPLYNVRTMEEVMSGVLSRPRSTASIVAFFSVAALLLAAIGIYGVLSFTVAQRRCEIGIRLALGAQARQIGALVVGQSMKLIAAGIAIGIPLSLLLARLFSTMLFGITAADPMTIASVTVVVVVAGWAAACLPARRAARVDPAGALRSQ